MMGPKELAQDIFLDKETGTIALCVDRVSVMLDIQEFFELFDRMRSARASLISDHNIIIETFETDNSTVHDTIVSPDSEDYN